MTAAAQGHLWDEPVDETEGDESTDSYCTPPEVMERVHKAAGSIRLDPWTNNYAISHGWVNAAESWTIDSGRHPDRSIDAEDWPLKAGDFVWGNPPYSGPHDFVSRFIFEMDRAQAWGMLLLKTDNRTRWSAWLLDRLQPIVLWKGPINFFHRGERARGNNFASTLYVVDGTGLNPEARKRHLQPIFEDVAWVVR